MARRESEPIVRHHVHLYESDIELLKELYGESSSVGFSKAVRIIVRSSCKKLRELRAQAIGPNPIPLSSVEDFINAAEPANRGEEGLTGGALPEGSGTSHPGGSG